MGTLCPTKEPMSNNQKYLKRSEDGQLKFFKIEVDENPVLVNSYAP